jgi:hypothetical protein
MNEKTYSVGDVVYAMGEQPDYFFILVKGALTMTTMV